MKLYSALPVSLLACALLPWHALSGSIGEPLGDCYKEWEESCTGALIAFNVPLKECEPNPEAECWSETATNNEVDVRKGTCYRLILNPTTGGSACHTIPTATNVPKRQCPCDSCWKFRDFDDPNTEITEYTRKCDAYFGGEPHLKTWHGQRFDYMGECDLVFLIAPALNNMTIHARTTIRDDYSYISNLAVMIDDSIMEVSGWGFFMVDGINVGDEELPFGNFAGYSINHTKISDKEHNFLFTLAKSEYLSIKTFKDFISIKITGSDQATFGDSVGLLGNYQTGERLARDGTTVIDNDIAFGEEWQVRDTEPQLFWSGNREPQYPQKCRYPAMAYGAKRHLLKTSGNSKKKKVSRKAAELACAHWEDDDVDNCIADVLLSGDVELAEAGGY